ncbi:hypothetical protein BJY16_008249 [Actinoplanes octamycinicus]|uniref:DUF4232 domain-containing protein n=1 Tax=Actinoplanes octamycinicus TaxID=135948 RepID=A0A7W7H698_9ACTN|nr:DUF4232 domain-containing protein [Actinoplanes octamycinicus]MBB4744790.1 hypothetical protein [Actinoplanes octamycinicus]GIE55373.1 hypothetical protein Aoc01nite_07750 [Actinoplanes octamycinicus]
MTGSWAYRRAVPLAVVALLAGCAPRPIGTADGVAPWVPTPSALPSSTSSPAASPSRAGQPTAPACPPEGVRVQAGGGDAASGLRVLTITLVNCGTKPYEVNGYPAVQALDEDQEVLDLQVLTGVTEILGSMPWDTPPKPVTLRPGQRASAALAWRNTYDDTRRPPANGTYLRVAPVAGRLPQTVEPEAALDFGSTGRFAVSAWQPAPATPTSPATPR